MTAEQLLGPRFEVLDIYPNSEFEKGEVLKRIKNATNDIFHTDDTKLVGNFLTLSEIVKYPHLFRKMNWWEKRTEEEMPVKVKSYQNSVDVYFIEKWDIKMNFGYTDLNKRQGCDLTCFTPEYGYYPVD